MFPGKAAGNTGTADITFYKLREVCPSLSFALIGEIGIDLKKIFNENGHSKIPYIVSTKNRKHRN